MKKTVRSSVPIHGASPNRYAGVPAKAVPLLRDIDRALQAGDLVGAERSLALAMVHAPQHAQTLLLLGRSQYMRGRWLDAVQTLRDAERAAPDSVEVLIQLGRAQSAALLLDAALVVLRRACALRPDPATLLELGVVLDANALADDALEVADRALAIDPGHARARLLRARCLQALGRVPETAAEYRELIRRRQEVPAAWFALMDIKTVRLGDTEQAVLKREAADPRWNDVEQSFLRFALGRACEDAGDYSGAVSAFDWANRLVRQRTVWDAARWNREVDRLLAAFDRPQQGEDAVEAIGGEVIFIVGLPRSGTTLVEQILGVHSKVEGANELPDMAAVLDAETARRKRPLAEWADVASAEDWYRLGRQYLERTAHWRKNKPVHSDKMPENWSYTGAIRRMLPRARIIDSRRDPVETAWSCYKQLFGPHRVAFSYDAIELGSYWRSYDRFMQRMLCRHPSAIRVQSLEALIASPEREVRELLAFCGLEWESACLQPHNSVRAVRTASSAQVREPIRRAAARADSYGVSLTAFRDRVLNGQQDG